MSTPVPHNHACTVVNASQLNTHSNANVPQVTMVRLANWTRACVKPNNHAVNHSMLNANRSTSALPSPTCASFKMVLLTDSPLNKPTKTHAEVLMAHSHWPSATRASSSVTVNPCSSNHAQAVPSGTTLRNHAHGPICSSFPKSVNWTNKSADTVNHRSLNAH